MSLEEKVKLHEGFVSKIYLDSLSKKTIGWGHLITPDDHFKEGVEYSKEELEDVFQKDLKRAMDDADDLIKTKIAEKAREVIIEMVYQLGKTGVSKFKNMWSALQESPPNYFEAHVQMLDSRWNKQTPGRCVELSETMKSCS
jgi:lysozyme|tara:strand:+ start:129 stop:554 length:426 start_codon:yes stop_codon:yes gene_type:complete